MRRRRGLGLMPRCSARFFSNRNYPMEQKKGRFMINGTFSIQGATAHWELILGSGALK